MVLNLKEVDMKFVKLHQNGRELLVNMNNIAEVHTTRDYDSLLYFNFVTGDDQVSITVDESIDEILELIKKE